MRRADVVYVVAAVAWLCAVGMMTLQLNESSGAVVHRAPAQVDSVWMVLVGAPGDSDAILHTVQRVSALLDSICVTRSGKAC